MRTFYWYMAGWLYMVSKLPVLLHIKYLDLRGRSLQRDDLANRVSMRMARRLFLLTGSEVAVRGWENVPQDRPVLFVSNHQCHMDSAVIHGFIEVPKGFMSIVEAKKIPILRSWMKYMGCVFIDRGNARQAFKGIAEGIRQLERGHSMVIYPEGKLSQSNTPGEFKKGCLRMAVKAGVPIVPVTLRDSYKVMKKNGMGIRASRVECIISEPIPAKIVESADEDELIKTVRSMMIANQGEFHCQRT